jgi:hypothetical protein
MLCVSLCGCFAELGGGYYPVVNQTITPPSGVAVEAHGGAWVASIKVGFFLDVVDDDSFGFALGWSPFGTNVLRAKAPLRSHGGGGNQFRGDLVLPRSLFGTEDIRARIVSELELLTDTGAQQSRQVDLVDHDGNGKRYFLGVGLSRTEDYGSQLVQIGVDHMSLDTDAFADPTSPIADDGVSTSAWGLSASITITVLPAKHPNGITDYVKPTVQTSPGAFGPEICDGATCVQTCPTKK